LTIFPGQLREWHTGNTRKSEDVHDGVLDDNDSTCNRSTVSSSNEIHEVKRRKDYDDDQEWKNIQLN